MPDDEQPETVVVKTESAATRRLRVSFADDSIRFDATNRARVPPAVADQLVEAYDTITVDEPADDDTDDSDDS